MTGRLGQPGSACLIGKHIFIDVRDAATGSEVGGWCLWCGGGAYDGERITDDGRPAGFTPQYVARVPDGFFRLLEDAPP